MPTLALAGGTSPSLGRAIITTLLSQRPVIWKIVILSRSSHIPFWLRAVDQAGTHSQICAVDYHSMESLASALKGVHTVVSVTSAIDGTQAQIQINLLNAAVKAGCERFAPSQWGFGLRGWENVETTKWAFDGVWEECMKHKDKIECARFNVGSFMNYLGHGIYPVESFSEIDVETQMRQLRTGRGYMVGEDQACQGLSRQGDLRDGSGAFLIGLKNGIAELPVKDDGQWPRITMTMMKDVGYFVAASLDLPKWRQNMSMVGDTLTMGELLAHAEAVTGKRFQVETIKREDLEKRLENIAPDDFMGRMWVEFKLAYTRDLDDEVVLDPVMNRLCPKVKPTTVREYMEMFWTGR
ncbi:NmrA-like family protein [Zopfia rhizophila CBS 207.26]|uniref:NmrA-like family protein n=1 Tax=Zopfia rhizophila CBS 207.26 TaxID=1314779 RepID=A0A6A6EVN0_9PEZI|nr:NmrA-like family protein [Zopfia rhizophila CBS 207.26]